MKNGIARAHCVMLAVAALAAARRTDSESVRNRVKSQCRLWLERL